MRLPVLVVSLAVFGCGVDTVTLIGRESTGTPNICRGIQLLLAVRCISLSKGLARIGLHLRWDDAVPGTLQQLENDCIINLHETSTVLT